jgi:hypothetical protein
MSQDLDFSNPLAVIGAFFFIILTSLVFILRFAMFGVFGLVIGIPALLVVGFETFKKQ